jgi:crotonobetainyl-CoA:carnitine CoA-transferase CaiB-like acyl-CoA transferase
MAAGLTGLSAVLMALIGRERSGKGDYVDIAMFDSLLPWGAHIAGSAIAGGEAPRSDNQRSLGGAAFYQVYATRDRRHVALGAREIKFVRNLLAALGREDLIALGEAEAGPDQAPLTAFLRETFLTRNRDEWVQWFEDKDVAFSPVLDFAEALASEHVGLRGLLVEAGGAHHIAPPIRFAGEPEWQPSEAPELGI